VGSKDNILGNVSSRTYRAEETYAIKNGKWYYEVEIFTAGSIKIGWSNITQACTIADISEDPDSYTFDCSAARKWHLGNDVFGKKCCIGDVVGVMIDLQDKTISFSLNGEFLLDPVGSESAFENININGGFVPAFNLSNGQKIKVNFGQDVNSLRYFTNCGLQEGYEPFAVNMTKQITFWYSNEIPIFETVTQNHESLEMIRNR
jgi:ryanodine receptor 2